MSFFVRVWPTRSQFKYILKLAALLVLAGLLNHLRDMTIGPDDVKPFLENFRDALFVGLPVAGLTLILLLRLDRLHRELAAQALTDQLTQLPNRRAFFQQVQKMHRAQGSVVLVDIDYFKRVNDTFGHLIGDASLVEVGRFLQDWVGPKDLICRFGGEEFALLLRDTTVEEALEQAGRYTIGYKIDIGGQSVKVALSIGIAQWVPGEDFDMALNNADTALYHAKNNGRAQAQVFAFMPAQKPQRADLLGGQTEKADPPAMDMGVAS